jgi:hypothetical protein
MFTQLNDAVSVVRFSQSAMIKNEDNKYRRVNILIL